MNQNIITIIGGIAILAIIVVVYIKNRKGNEDSTAKEIFDFLDSVSDKLADFLAEAVEIMSKDPSKYESEDEFYKDLIGEAIEIIKKLCEENNINLKWLSTIPQEDLENYIYTIIERVIDRVEVKAIIEQPKEEPKAEVMAEEIHVDAIELENIDNILNDFYNE